MLSIQLGETGCYLHESSHLSWSDEILCSAEGVQQDDVTLGGPFGSLCDDILSIRSAADVGLHLNLSSPLGSDDSILAAVEEKTLALKRMGDRLRHFTLHDAIILLRHSFAIPRLTYLLHSSPTFLSPSVGKALSSAGILSTLEPSGLSRSDGKRPDGMTLILWEKGKPLVWDATVPDSLAVSYRSQAIAATGTVAASAESQKMSKYTNLPLSLLFCPLAIESLGALGPRSRHLIHHLGRRI
uniref:Uncharacterized protein n=1 Tax=Amphimedon queenslandica TaxID=400682 RepID=A0A1X7U678_AMPQE